MILSHAILSMRHYVYVHGAGTVGKLIEKVCMAVAAMGTELTLKVPI